MDLYIPALRTSTFILADFWLLANGVFLYVKQRALGSGNILIPQWSSLPAAWAGVDCRDTGRAFVAIQESGTSSQVPVAFRRILPSASRHYRRQAERCRALRDRSNPEQHGRRHLAESPVASGAQSYSIFFDTASLGTRGGRARPVRDVFERHFDR